MLASTVRADSFGISSASTEGVETVEVDRLSAYRPVP